MMRDRVPCLLEWSSRNCRQEKRTHAEVSLAGTVEPSPAPAEDTIKFLTHRVSCSLPVHFSVLVSGALQCWVSSVIFSTSVHPFASPVHSVAHVTSCVLCCAAALSRATTV